MSKTSVILLLLIQLITYCLPAEALPVGKKDPKIEELEKQLKSVKTDKEKVEIGIKLTQYCLDKNNADCENYANAAIKTAKKAKMDNTCAELYCMIGTFHFQK